jgi:MFS family permease
LEKPEGSLLTRDFLNISAVSLLLFCGHYLVLATLPEYVLLLGGDVGAVGFVSGVFATSALIFRPIVGIFIDRFGRVPVIRSGTLGTFVASIGFFVAPGIWPLAAVRFAQGAGFSAISTGGSVFVGDIAPVSRRAEAVGYYGMFGTIALALMPTVGSRIVDLSGYTGLFIAVSTCAMLAFMILLLLREPVTKGARANSLLESFFCKEAVAPALVALLFAADFGAVVAFMPLFLTQSGFADPALYFTPYAVAVLVGRTFSGRLADRVGRIQTAVPGLGLGSISLFLLTLTPTWTIVLAAVCFAFAMSMVQPSLTALVLERVSPAQRGAALGTFFAAFDLGIGAGSMVWGLVAQRSDFATMFALCAVTPLLTAAYPLALNQVERRRRLAAISSA